MHIEVTENVKYIGVDDVTLDLFEGQYVVPEGVSYNSYVILDEKVAVLDTVDARGQKEWEANLMEILGGRAVDYLVIHHLEPDHSGGIVRLRELFPEVVFVGNQKTFQMLKTFFGEEFCGNHMIVKEQDKLVLGEHVLTFYMAPMVHWPEVMVSYEQKEQILFSADGFGKFGALCKTDVADWACEARRYYFNIVGKFGAAVQSLLKKLAGLEISYICPLHGPVLKENLSYYLDLYHTWSRYEAESEGVLIAYASFHGNTARAANMLGEMLRKKGNTKVVVSDLARSDMAEVLEDAFRYDRMIVAAASYDGTLAPRMQTFLQCLQSKAYQNRKVGIIENGSWAPSAGRYMKEMFEKMKNVEIVEPVVTIRATVKDTDYASLKVLADTICKG